MTHRNALHEAHQALRSGDMQGAIKLLQGNLDAPGGFIETRLTLAELMLRRQDLETALVYLQEAEGADSEHPHTLTLLAHTLRRSGRHIDALKYLERAGRSEAANQDNLKFVASELVLLKRYDAAIATLKRVEPMDAQSFHNLGFCHLTLGQFGQALPIYRKLFSKIQNNPNIARELSLAAAALREYGTAVKAYSRYIELVSPTAQDYLRFSDLQLMNHDVTESERLLGKAVAMGDNSADSKLLAAKLSRLKGDYSQALRSAFEVLKSQELCGTAWKIISELCGRSDISEELIARLKDAFASPEISGQDKELCGFALAEIFSKTGDFSNAYQQMHAANKVKQQEVAQAGNSYSRSSIEKEIASITRAFSDKTKIKNSTEQIAPIFITGMPRSGTTIINRLFQATGKLQCVGESESIPFLFSQLQHRLGREQDHFIPELSQQDWERLGRDYLARTDQDGRPIVDKMPHNFLYTGMILSMFPHARIIQLRRDPFDVCMSIYSKPFSEGHSYACNMTDLAHYFWCANRLMDFWAQTFPSQVFDFDFDLFLKDPSARGASLFNEIGLEWQDSFLEPSKLPSQAFTFSELQVRKVISLDEASKWSPYRDIARDMAEALAREKA